MSIFDAVRHISSREAAERAGIALKRRGDKAWALCPLHRERTPSLCLYEEPKRGWYCYGCHRGGDAVKFYEDLYHLEPLEAAKLLAGAFGILADAPSPARHATESSLSFEDDDLDEELSDEDWDRIKYNDAQVEENKIFDALGRAFERVWRARTRLDQLERAGSASPINSVYMAAVRVLELAEASLTERWKPLDEKYPENPHDHDALLDAYITHQNNLQEEAAQGSRTQMQQRAPHSMQMKNSTRGDRI